MLPGEMQRVIDRGLTAKGSQALSAEQLLQCVKAFRSEKLYVQSMEAYEVKVPGKDHPMRLDLSILGLGDDENDITDTNRDAYNKIAEEKAQASISEGIQVEFIVWLNKT